MRRGLLFSLLAVPLVAVAILGAGVSSAAVPAVYLAAVTPWLARCDLRSHRLPNALVLPGIGVGLAAGLLEWLVTGRIPVVPLVAGGGYAGFLLVFNLLGGMGMGDVKLAAALGLATGNPSVAVLSPLAAFVAGGVVSIILLAAGARDRRIAFGPFLLGGFWAAACLLALSRL